MALTYPEAIVVGLVQGVTELFPVSSLGHSVLLPALVGGRWASDLDVSAPESPYLAFIVGLHVATAIALLVFFRADWVRIVRGLLTSVRYRRVSTSDERLAWLIVAGDDPGRGGRSAAGAHLPYGAGPAGAGGGVPDAERDHPAAGGAAAADRGAGAPVPVGAGAVDARHRTWTGRDAATRDSQRRRRRVLIGSAQILALLPGISRSGVTMVGGLVRGLTTRTPPGSPSCWPRR